MGANILQVVHIIDTPVDTLNKLYNYKPVKCN